MRGLWAAVALRDRRAGREPGVVEGQPGRVLSELATIGVPVDCMVLAGELWPDLQGERDPLRRNGDRVRDET